MFIGLVMANNTSQYLSLVEYVPYFLVTIKIANFFSQLLSSIIELCSFWKLLER